MLPVELIQIEPVSFVKHVNKNIIHEANLVTIYSLLSVILSVPDTDNFKVDK